MAQTKTCNVDVRALCLKFVILISCSRFWNSSVAQLVDLFYTSSMNLNIISDDLQYLIFCIVNFMIFCSIFYPSSKVLKQIKFHIPSHWFDFLFLIFKWNTTHFSTFHGNFLMILLLHWLNFTENKLLKIVFCVFSSELNWSFGREREREKEMLLILCDFESNENKCSHKKVG